MGALPAWKLKRELLRLARKVLTLPKVLPNYLLGTRFYDLVHAQEVAVARGALPIGGKAAIYLIFPSSGVKESHFLALRHLRGKGYAPIVVSNLAIGDADRERLLDSAALLIERPNYGYDFGGYREAVKALGPYLPRLERLAIFNDSTWFPVRPSADWIGQAEAVNRDLVAAASNYGFARPDIDAFRDIAWTYGTDHPNFHYCSFALLIRPAILRDPSFLKFWLRFPMTSDKTRTVRRGEIGFSQWVIRHGFSHGATGDVTDLDEELAALSDAQLREVVRTTMIIEEQRLTRIKAGLLADPRADRRAMIGFVLTAVARRGASYVLADHNIRSRDFAFLKKSPVWLDEDASDRTIELVRSLGGEAARIILDEILELRTRRAPRFAEGRTLLAATDARRSKHLVTPASAEGPTAGISTSDSTS